RRARRRRDLARGPGRPRAPPRDLGARHRGRITQRRRADAGLRLHAARLSARRRRPGAPLRGALALHPGACRVGRPAPDRDPDRSRRALCRTVALLGPPLHASRVRPHHQLLDAADPARLARRDWRLAGRYRLRHLPLHPTAHGGARERGSLHLVRDPVRVPRLSHPCRGNGGRVRRPHLSRGAEATYLPRARRPSTRGDPAVRSVVMAYQDIGWVSLDELLSLGAEIAAVVTHADDPGEHVWSRPGAARARQPGLPALMPPSANPPDVIATIARLAPDVIFSFYFRELLSPAVLGLARHAALNLHGSLLPRYRGRCP